MNKKWTFLCAAVLILAASLLHFSLQKGNQNMKDTTFRVIVYYPSWEPETQFKKIRFDIVTHIMYAFAIPTKEGSLLPLEHEETAKKLIKLAHANGAKIMLSIGGWSYNGIPLEETFMEATNTTEKIKTLTDAILTMCLTYGFDGIDLDWEHPRMNTNSKEQYEAFVCSLGEALHAKNKLFSAALISGVEPNGTRQPDAMAHTDKALTCYDFINIMAYDGNEGAGHSPYSFAVNSVEYWRDIRNVPAKKINLGVPFYARPGWTPYETILTAHPDAYLSDTFTENGTVNYYNGIATIKKKTAYALNNIGGIMVWEIAEDTLSKERSLLHAIGEVLGIVH